MFSKGEAVLCIDGAPAQPTEGLGYHLKTVFPRKGMIYIVKGPGNTDKITKLPRITIVGVPNRCAKLNGGDAGWYTGRFRKLVDPDSKENEEPVRKLVPILKPKKEFT